MKKYLKIILAVLTAIGLIIALVFFLTKDIVQTADNFLSAVKQGKMDKASSYLSKEFRATTPKDKLKRYLTDNLLHKMKQTSWHSRSRENGLGEINGSIILEDGQSIPMTITLIEEDDDWKIFSIIKSKKKRAGLQDYTSLTKMPNEREQLRLVAETNKVFVQAVHDKSMQKFHDHVSYTWQKQVSLEALNKAFHGFIKADINLRPLNTLSPAFLKQPFMENDVKMIITGEYPSKPLKVTFTHKYIYEGLGWKLIGFEMNAR